LRSPTSWRDLPAQRSWLAFGSAAAAVILVIVLLPMMRQSPPPPLPSGESVRGSTLQPLAPIGEVRPPVQFRWASPVAAARFEIEVRDDEHRLVFSLATDRPPADLPPDRLAGLVPGRSYSWVVIALAATGEEIMRAPSRSFSLFSER
jgi:hypothetical protein